MASLATRSTLEDALAALLFVCAGACLSACASSAGATSPVVETGPGAPVEGDLKDEPAIPQSTRGAFDRAAASAALGNATKQAATQCKSAGGPAGIGKIVVKFDPGTGHVTFAEIREPPFKDTTVGDCVVRVFLRAKIPPFDQPQPVLVSKPFRID
jgi:hypothetical protein